MTKTERILLAIYLILVGLAGLGVPVGLVATVIALITGVFLLLPLIHQPRP
jgi:hypothetical protein